MIPVVMLLLLLAQADAAPSPPDAAREDFTQPFPQLRSPAEAAGSPRGAIVRDEETMRAPRLTTELLPEPECPPQPGARLMPIPTEWPGSTAGEIPTTWPCARVQAVTVGPAEAPAGAFPRSE